MLRTWLFAPANRARHVEKALASDADVAVLDLEDACPDGEKLVGRASAREATARGRQGLLHVRVNSVSSGLLKADLEAVVGQGLDGVILPKAESAAEVAEANRIIGLIERRLGLSEGRIDLVPIIESALGLAEARAIGSACRRVRRLAFGPVDFALDLGLTVGPEEGELAPYRASLVLASRLEGLEAPIDGAGLVIADETHMVRSAMRSRAMGFQGKLCVHPRQLAPVMAAFAPGQTKGPGV